MIQVKSKSLTAQTVPSTPMTWIRYGIVLGFVPLLVAVLGLDFCPICRAWLQDAMASRPVGDRLF